MTCKAKQENNGVCPHHNLQCGWPQCNEPAQPCPENLIDALTYDVARRDSEQQCRTDGRCQYAIDSGAEGMGHCPKGKCVMPAQQEPVAWFELLREARDNCKASIVEEGISASRKEYRIDLEARLTAALNTSPPAQQEPVAWATQLNEYAHIKWGAKRPEYPMVYEFPLYTSPPPQRKSPTASRRTHD